MRDAVRAVDLVGDHHEAHRSLAVVVAPGDRLAFRSLDRSSRESATVLTNRSWVGEVTPTCRGRSLDSWGPRRAAERDRPVASHEDRESARTADSSSWLRRFLDPAPATTLPRIIRVDLVRSDMEGFPGLDGPRLRRTIATTGHEDNGDDDDDGESSSDGYPPDPTAHSGIVDLAPTHPWDTVPGWSWLPSREGATATDCPGLRSAGA